MHTCFGACLYSLPLQVWQYTASMAHFRTCLEIAACAGAEKRRYTLATTYDELCRKQWNLKADRGDRGFEVNVASLEKDKDLLERARVLYDAANAGAKALSMLDIFLHARLIFSYSRPGESIEGTPFARGKECSECSKCSTLWFGVSERKHI